MNKCIFEMDLGLEIKIANNFFSRLKGLMFNKKKLNYGLLLMNTNGIHTCFMFQNIDIMLLDKNFNVLHTYKNIKPWKIILPKKDVVHTLELPTKNNN